MRNDTKPTLSSQSTCAASRYRTSGSSPVGPAQIGTSQPALRAAWIAAATTGAPAQTISVVAPACRAASTRAPTSDDPAATTPVDTTVVLSRTNPARIAASPSPPYAESSARMAAFG